MDPTNQLNGDTGQSMSLQEPEQPTSPIDPLNSNSRSPAETTTQQESVQNPEAALETFIAPTVPPVKTGMSRKKKIILSIIIFLFLMTGTLIGSIYALAYHKIELKSNPELQKKIEFLVMELPFTPKSARYLTYKMITIEKDYSSQSFDMSAAVDTNSGQADVLGLSNFDIAAKGDVDYRDKENLLLSMNLSITKDFNLDFKAKEKFVYFKINKVPSALLALVGLNSDLLSALLNIWVSYDTTPLATEARSLLNESDETSDSLDEEITKEIEEYLDQSILSQMEVTKDMDGEFPVYKMHLTMTPAMIDLLEQKLNEKQKTTSDLYVTNPGTEKQKLSELLKDVTIDIWLDQKSYYTRRVSTSFKITPDSSLTQKLENTNVLGIEDSIVPSLDSTISVAMVFKFSDFGKTVTIETPDAITFDEYAQRFSEVLLEVYTSQSELLQP